MAMNNGNRVYIGLSAEEVEASRLKYGDNVLSQPKGESLIRKFLFKFKDSLIVILLIAGAASIGISFYEYYALDGGGKVFIEPVGIFAAIILATGLAFIFEYKADKEFELLNTVNDEEPVRVIRSGNTTMVARRDVVVGDIIVLGAGEEVPADARLLESTRLSVDESSLTGEPLCHKSANPMDGGNEEATYPSDMVLRGTKVMEGHGIAEVEAVGDATENGKVNEASKIDNSVKTPLDMQLDRLGKFIAVASYVIAALVIVGRLTMYFLDNGAIDDWVGFLAYALQSVMIAVTLVVVSVPEGLPMAVTLSLAYSMRRMLRTGNLVRKLHACETMGAVTTICTDKTGTLTANRMMVADVVMNKVDAPADARRKEWMDEMTAMALNSTAELDYSNAEAPLVVGNPTEGALLLWIDANGGDYRKIRAEWRRVEELPFSTERKLMATVVENISDGRRRLLVKGAPEAVLRMSAVSEKERKEFTELLSGYQHRAMRTLGFAHLDLSAEEHPIEGEALNAENLVWDGVVAISDPVREDVPEAIERVLAAGIKIKIVTGDTAATAIEISRKIGLWKDSDGDKNIVTGSEVAAMTDEQLRTAAPQWKIIARARPLDKKRLVEALQANGEVVAVTGDGTNDAPALKAAHVGLSMGDGTSVAKEASDITIVNNSFSGIGNAVMWGRSLYRNIQRFILFQLTVNVVACMTVLIGSFMGTQAPLTVTQMLWVNLVMDTFAAMALASLPPSEDVMNDKPRSRSQFIITGAMGRFILWIGGLMGAMMVGLLYIFEHCPINELQQILHPTLGVYKGLSGYELSLFFTIFVMLQMWNLFNAKAFGSARSALRLKGCGEFMFIVAVILVGQILIVSVGGEFFNVVPLKVGDWLAILLGTSAVLWVGELVRCFKRR